MKLVRNNLWAHVGSDIHRLAFMGDHDNVITVCGEQGRTSFYFHVCDEAGPNAAPRVYLEHHCAACVAARSSLCVCGFRTLHAPDSSAFHLAHREHHLRAFPASDTRTIANLDRFVEIHLERELRAERAVS